MIILGGMFILVSIKCLFSIENINNIFSKYQNADYNYFIAFLILFIIGVPLLIAGINSMLLAGNSEEKDIELWTPEITDTTPDEAVTKPEEDVAEEE